MSLVWPLIRNCLSAPRQTAVVDDQKSYAYGQLLGGAMFVASAIDDATRRDKVGILLPTSGAFPVALLATWLGGRAAVPLNYLLSAEDLAYVIRDSGIDTIVTAGRMLDFLRSSLGEAESPGGAGQGGASRPAGIPADVRLLKLDEMSFSGLPPMRWPARTDDDDLAALLYTSGTSGKPKGVMLSHGNLHANARQIREHVHVTRRDVFFGVLPQFHSFGLTGLTLAPLYLKCKVIYTARFMPKKILSLLREHRPTVYIAIPSMFNGLLTLKDMTEQDWSSIRMPISGGEPLPRAVYDAYRQRLRVTIYQGYGLTETSPVTHVNTPDRQRWGSVGTAVPGVEHFILGEDGTLLGPDEEGEIALAGPNIMQGYYRLPQLTEEVITRLQPTDRAAPVRAFRTGDIGRSDAEGFLYITGRKKEMMIIGGENVFPREIEEALDQHPQVHASAVVSKADESRGEVPIAFVELSRDEQGRPAEASTFDEPAVRAWLRERIAPFKVPREIRVVDELPRNPTGKIMRRHLRDRL